MIRENKNIPIHVFHMPKITIGFITNHRLLADEDQKFLRVAKKINVNMVVFNAAEDLDLKQIKEKADKCDIILNDEADYLGLELAKTLEVLGYKVVELSKSYYYTEDKWLFYLKCLKNRIPVPETILLSTDLVSVKKELEEFGHFPVVLKRVEGFHGDFVDKADNSGEAVAVIKRFWKKGENYFPILAQEFVKSFSYRVTTIGGKVAQTAIKKSHDWKATGGSAVRFWKFKIDKELKKILDKLKKIIDITVCGIDLAKKNGHWVVIEVNAEPSLKFFDCEYNLMIEKSLKYLKASVQGKKRKPRH